MTESVIQQLKSMFRRFFIAAFVMSVAGCSHLPLSETDPEGEPVETASGTSAEPQDDPGPAIAVGSGARRALFASLKTGEKALAPGERGYFLDVLEARLRQILIGSPIRMQRTDDRILLTVPGSLSFDTDSAKVVDAVIPMLGDIAAVLVEFDKTLVSVLGHTDDRGDAAYNQSLSERRAVAVALILARTGVAKDRLLGIGYGQERPAIKGETERARTANRRIEILIEPVVAGNQVP